MHLRLTVRTTDGTFHRSDRIKTPPEIAKEVQGMDSAAVRDLISEVVLEMTKEVGGVNFPMPGTRVLRVIPTIAITWIDVEVLP